MVVPAPEVGIVVLKVDYTYKLAALAASNQFETVVDVVVA